MWLALDRFILVSWKLFIPARKFLTDTSMHISKTKNVFPAAHFQSIYYRKSEKHFHRWKSVLFKAFDTGHYSNKESKPVCRKLASKHVSEKLEIVVFLNFLYTGSFREFLVMLLSSDQWLALPCPHCSSEKSIKACKTSCNLFLYLPKLDRTETVNTNALSVFHMTCWALVNYPPNCSTAT